MIARFELYQLAVFFGLLVFGGLLRFCVALRVPHFLSFAAAALVVGVGAGGYILTWRV